MSSFIQTLQNYKNDAIATVGGINSAVNSWSLSGGVFGSPAFKIYLTIDPDLSTKEIVRVTVAGTNITQAERGLGGTTAQSHAQNAVVRMTSPAELWNITADFLESGWTTVPDHLALAFVSATSFTVSGDWTSILQKGDKIKLTNSSTKYFYVIVTSFAAGLTTVTVTGGSNYSLAAGAISGLYYSKMSSPSGFPAFFDWVPTGSVQSGTFTSLGINHARFRIENGMCTAFVYVDFSISVGSQGLKMSVPVNITGANTGYANGVRLNDGTVRGATMYGEQSSQTLFVERYDGATFANSTVSVRGYLSYAI